MKPARAVLVAACLRDPDCGVERLLPHYCFKYGAEAYEFWSCDWLTYDHNFPAEARVDHVLEWLDRPLATRPDFVTLYFEAVDSAGHRFGPDAAETTAAVASIDQAIGRLIDGLTTRGLLADSCHHRAQKP